MSFVNRWYTKRVPFLSKMVYKKRIRGGGGGKVGGPSSYNTLLSAPLAHWAIITARSEKLCVRLLLVIVTFFAVCFLLFIVFRWNVPFSLHQSPLSTLSVIFHVKHHVAALDQSKHSCTTSSFPVRWWERICPISWRICKLLAVFIRPGNHGLTQSPYQVFNYVAVPKL